MAVKFLIPLVAICIYPMLVTARALVPRGQGGCGSSPWSFDGSGHSTQTLHSRKFLVHLPKGYDENPQHPVVFSFHGYGGTSRSQEALSGLSKEGLLIDNKGIIAVYPLAAKGPGQHGKPATAWQGAPYSPKDVDDIGFVESILEALDDNLCIDPGRVYLTGMSNGGAFVNLLACTPSTSAKFAAFASVAPALYPDTLPFDGCSPAHPVPFINFHGTADKTVPFDGSDSDHTPSIPKWIEAWAERDGCNGDSGTVTHPFSKVEETTWECGASRGAVVVSIVRQGGTHRWPTKSPSGFDATKDEIIPFFNQFSLD